jgi:uncharacterized membrane protein (DUF373 family)
MIDLMQRRFEKVIVLMLMGLMMIFVAYGTLDLAFRTFRYLFVRAPSEFGGLERGQLMTLLHDGYSAFLLILIGLELMQTISMYLKEHVLHVEVVLTVALIAVARHAIDVDYRNASPWSLMGIALLTMALAGAYVMFRKSLTLKGGPARADTA